MPNDYWWNGMNVGQHSRYWIGIATEHKMEQLHQWMILMMMMMIMMMGLQAWQRSCIQSVVTMDTEHEQGLLSIIDSDVGNNASDSPDSNVDTYVSSYMISVSRSTVSYNSSTCLINMDPHYKHNTASTCLGGKWR
jgi:hypothetical protein